MKKLSFVMALFCLLNLPQIGFSQGITFAHGTLAEVTQQAKSEGKMIFVDCFTDWCGPCKWMAANTFTDEKVGDFFNKNFVNYKLDMEKGEGPAFAEKYGVRAYPTIIWIDGDGKLNHVIVGARDPKGFLEAAEIALDPSQNLAGYMDRFEKGERSPEFLGEYLVLMKSSGQDFGDAIDVWKTNVKPEDLGEEANWEVFSAIFSRLDSDYFTYVMENLDDLSDKIGREKVHSKVLEAHMQAINRAHMKEDEDTESETRSALKMAKIDGAEKALLNMDMYIARRNEDMTAFKKYASELANEYGQDDWNLLNTIAWAYFENFDSKKDLLKASQWAKRSVEIKPEYYNLDTYGMLLMKLGDTKNAKIYLGKAIEAAKASGDDYADTQKALDELSAE